MLPLHYHRLVDLLFRRQSGQSFPARALVGWFNWFLLFDEVVPSLVDDWNWGTIRDRVLICRGVRNAGWCGFFIYLNLSFGYEISLTSDS
jgi:hypothetical protein